MDNVSQTFQKIRANRDLSVFDVLSIDDLSDEDIQLILELAGAFEEVGTEKLDFLKGISIINAFYENSTRTRSSFEFAGKHLGADTINLTGSASSVKKGESLLDTTQTLAALQAQVLIMRSEYSGLQYFVAKHVPSVIVNAGDGWHEHPSQALLDAKTMLDHHGSMKGKVLTIIGDIRHSRVYGSMWRLMSRLGATIRVAAPLTFALEGMDALNIQFYTDLEEALPGTDVVYALRVQEERGAGGFVPSLREYSKTFGMTAKRFDMIDKNGILMHAGPVIRDIDVHSNLVTHPRSKIHQQVTNGLLVRKALLWLVGNRLDGKTKPYTPL